MAKRRKKKIVKVSRKKLCPTATDYDWQMANYYMTCLLDSLRVHTSKLSAMKIETALSNLTDDDDHWLANVVDKMQHYTTKIMSKPNAKRVQPGDFSGAQGGVQYFMYYLMASLFAPHKSMAFWEDCHARINKGIVEADLMAHVPKPSKTRAPSRSLNFVEKRAANAVDKLAQWEKKLRAAEKKVKEYQAKVNYYEKKGVSA